MTTHFRSLFLTAGLALTLAAFETAAGEVPACGSAAAKAQPAAIRGSGESSPLAPLFVAELQARSEAEPVVPAQGRRGSLVGSGDGTIEGPGLVGKVRWSNFEVQSPELCEMNLVGVIETHDGARVRFESQGYAALAKSPRWRTAGTMYFETDDARYDWLSETFALWEGDFDFSTFRARLRAWRISAPAESGTASPSAEAVSESESP